MKLYPAFALPSTAFALSGGVDIVSVRGWEGGGLGWGRSEHTHLHAKNAGNSRKMPDGMGKKGGDKRDKQSCRNGFRQSRGQKKPPEGGTHNTTQHHTTPLFSKINLQHSIFSLSLFSPIFPHHFIIIPLSIKTPLYFIKPPIS